eukprot:6467101-Amphidinium_carterae.6
MAFLATTLSMSQSYHDRTIAACVMVLQAPAFLAWSHCPSCCCNLLTRVQLQLETAPSWLFAHLRKIGCRASLHHQRQWGTWEHSAPPFAMQIQRSCETLLSPPMHQPASCLRLKLCSVHAQSRTMTGIPAWMA